MKTESLATPVTCKESQEGQNHCHSACMHGGSTVMARETDVQQGIFISVFYFASIWKNDPKQITASFGFICPHPLKCGNDTFEDCGKA